MAYVTLNDRQIFYTVQEGSPEKPTVLLIHGAGGRHTDWPAKVRFIPDTTVYALDLPGHAKSDHPGCDTIDAYTDIMVAFIEAFGLENVYVAGHSMGGAIAMTLALRGIPQITGLILVCTSARLRVGDAILGNIMTHYRKAIDFIMKYAWAPNAHPMKIGFAKRLLMETTPEVLYGDYSACNQFDVVEQVSQISLPTLVVSGTADQMTPAKFGQRLADSIVGAQFETITGGGHFLGQEFPDKLAAVINKFVLQAS
ncbi:MAG: alpha/beta hydrolase [Chloroflexota bacterium]